MRPHGLLRRLLLLQVGALLAGALAREPVQVHIAGFELLDKFSDKHSRANVVEGQDEDLAAASNAAEPIVVQALVEELPQGYLCKESIPSMSLY